MFTNFIYFIIIILIYTTYLPPEKTYLGGAETVVAFVFNLFLFIAINYRRYKDLTRKGLEQPDNSALQHRYDLLFTQHAILAIVFFAVNIYVLNLKIFLIRIPIFAQIPTLAAVCFLLLFIGHLAIIWWFAYQPYRVLFRTELTRRAFVTSHISFNIPIVIPWILISSVSDIIIYLPFEAPKKLLSTPEGQVILFSLFLGAMAVYIPALVQFFWKCRPLKGPVRNRIEALCEKAGFTARNIMIWPVFEGKMLTAGVMGIIKRFRYILITKGLISVLTDEELDAVIAHEIGHIKKKHLLFYLAFLIGYMILSYASFDVILYLLLSSDWLYTLPKTIQIEESTLVSIFFALSLALLLLIYFRFLFGYFMRNCERQADLYAFTVQGHPRALISSLEKIAFYTGTDKDTPSWHHFSIQERIDYLKKCAADNRWITRHDRKLRKSIIFFFCGLLVAGYFGYALNFGAMGKTLNGHFIETAVNRKLEQDPNNPHLYLTLGSLYHEKKEYEKAIHSYEKTLQIAPDHPEALNNLAWLYATCEDVEKRDYSKALTYSIQAANLKQTHYILDTLAESYYVNGLYKLAIEAEKRALAMNPGNRRYYEEQLKKFEKGLKN
ncbi:MAG: M48 family metalloprotease [Deltaproteobacteria bacterium]|nr:M48 family metalloprotease [Deltaproteobacteria bacterium]